MATQLNTNLISARDFAITRHTQMRLNDKIKFDIRHQQAVINVLDDMGYRDEWVTAAWLHDILAETKTVKSELFHLFGFRMSTLVDAVTGVGRTRVIRNTSIYNKIAFLHDAAILKTAERIADIEHSQYGSQIFDLFLKERDEFNQNVTRYVPYRMRTRLDQAYELRLSTKG